MKLEINLDIERVIDIWFFRYYNYIDSNSRADCSHVNKD